MRGEWPPVALAPILSAHDPLPLFPVRSYRAAWFALISRLIAAALPEGALTVTTPVLWVRR